MPARAKPPTSRRVESGRERPPTGVQHRWMVVRLLLGVFLAVLPAACRVSGASFRLDSDSRSPSLGIQLAPKAKKGDARGESASTPPPRAGDRDAIQLASDRETGPAGHPPSWSDWLGSLGRPRRIPLPLSPGPPPAAEDATEKTPLAAETF